MRFRAFPLIGFLFCLGAITEPIEAQQLPDREHRFAFFANGIDPNFSPPDFLGDFLPEDTQFRYRTGYTFANPGREVATIRIDFLSPAGSELEVPLFSSRSVIVRTDPIPFPGTSFPGIGRGIGAVPLLEPLSNPFELAAGGSIEVVTAPGDPGVEVGSVRVQSSVAVAAQQNLSTQLGFFLDGVAVLAESSPVALMPARPIRNFTVTVQNNLPAAPGCH